MRRVPTGVSSYVVHPVADVMKSRVNYMVFVAGCLAVFCGPSSGRAATVWNGPNGVAVTDSATTNRVNAPLSGSAFYRLALP